MAKLIYAGIDEAGYGPMFGPFVVARSVFVIEQAEPISEKLPSIWELLENAICQSISDRRRRIAVNDSKKLYTPAAGLAHLERGVLAFAALLDHHPDHLDAWLRCIGHDPASLIPDLLWYSHAEDTTGPALPTACDAGLISIARSTLARSCEDASITLGDLKACVLYEDRYNRMCAATRSKGRTAWTIVSQHLDQIFRQFGEHHPRVVVDRQGGRERYLDPLKMSFPDAHIEITEETVYRAAYRLHQGPHTMDVSFEINSEENHLPVALASMTAKYTRELLMQRFNAYFHQHAPDLKPTKGYAQDGKRFLKDIAPLLDQLGIPVDQIVRER